jgi:hypothetical protein
MYKITDYTKKRAEKLNLYITPSKNPKKKLDIYKDNKFITSIGDIHYGDFPTFKKEYGAEYANRRKIAYYQRHKKDNRLKGKLAQYLLW